MAQFPSLEFPQPMSTANPYASAAAGAGGGAMQLATALRSAAAQQQQLQAQREKEAKAAALAQWAGEEGLRKAGYTPYDPPEANGRPTLQRSNLPDALVDQSRITGPDPWSGKRWVMPAATPDATPQQTFSDTQSVLDKGGRAISPEGNVQQHSDVPRYRMDAQGNMTDTGMFGINGPVEDQGRVQTPPGSSQSYYMPTQGELETEKARVANANKPGPEPTLDTEHFNVPVSIDHKAGAVTALKLPEGVTHNDKPSKYTYARGVDGKGNVYATRTSDESGIERWSGKSHAWVPLEDENRLEPPKKDPTAPNAPKTATPAQLNSIEGKKRVKLARAEAAFKKANAGGYTDPEAVEQLRKDKQDAQDAYEQSLSEFGVPAQHVEYPAEEPAAAPAGSGRGAPQAPGGRGAAAAPKTVSLQQLDAYVAAQQKTNPKFTRADALREAKGRGYAIGQ